MRIRLYFALIVLALSLPAAADLSTVTQAYEIPIGELRLPRTANGTLGFRTCSDCASQTIRVKGSTRYVLNGRSVTLEKFKSKLDSTGGRRDAAATVMHHLESNVITAVKVRLR